MIKLIFSNFSIYYWYSTMSELQLLINRLMDERIFTKLDNIYYCSCGSNMKRKQIRKHLECKKHVNYIESMNNPIQSTFDSEINVEVSESCSICYSDKKEFFKCFKCKQNHCMECHEQINRCPFCRVFYMTNDEILFNKQLTNMIYRINAQKNREERAMLYYGMCRYLIINKTLFEHDCFKDVRKNILYSLVRSYEQGFECGMIFYQSLL